MLLQGDSKTTHLSILLKQLKIDLYFLCQIRNNRKIAEDLEHVS